MHKRELSVRHGMSQSQLEAVLTAWAQEQQAEVRPMGRLVRRYKTEGENIHWHITGLKKGMGTVKSRIFRLLGLLQCWFTTTDGAFGLDTRTRV